MNSSRSVNEFLLKINSSPSYQMQLRIFQIVIPIICTYGIGVNILNILVISRNFYRSVTLNLESRVSMAYISLVGLGVTNLWICVTYFPIVYLSKIHRRKSIFYYYALHGPNLINIGMTINVWIVTLISMGRCIAVYKPLLWRMISKSIKINYFTFSVLTVVCILLRVPDFVHSYYGTTETPDGTVYIIGFHLSSTMFWYRILLAIFSNVLPFVLIFVTTMMTIVKVRLRTIHHNSRLVVASHRSNHLIKLLIISIGLFFFCSFPFETLHLSMNYIISWMERNKKISFDNLKIYYHFNILVQWTLLFQLMGPVIDSSVYFLGSKYYRRSLQALVSNRCKSCLFLSESRTQSR